MVAPNIFTKVGALNVGTNVGSVAFTVGSEAANVINVAMVLSGPSGDTAQRVVALPYFLTSDAGGTTINGAYSVQPAIGSNGLLLAAQGALTAETMTDSSTGTPVTTVEEVVDMIATTASSVGDATNGALNLSTSNTYNDSTVNSAVNAQLDTVADSVIAAVDAAVDVSTGLIVTNVNTLAATIGDNFSSLTIMINKLSADMLGRNNDSKVQGWLVFTSAGLCDVDFGHVGADNAYLNLVMPDGSLATSGIIAHV